MFEEKNDSCQKVIVWSGMCVNGVLLESYFVDGNINGTSYLDILK